MPEAPDLEAIRGFFNERVLGLPIVDAEVRNPIVARFPPERFPAVLKSNRFTAVDRYGKFLLFRLVNGDILVVNAMLTGRFQYVATEEKRRGRTCATVTFENGRQMRYVDTRLMGKLYLVPEAELGAVPQFAEMGPDLLDPALTEEVFRQRLKRHRGQIKGVLVNHKFVAGIGNAYSDEILFVAGIHPYRKASALSDDEVGRLYHAVGDVMRWAIPIVAEKMRDELSYEERREHLRVHRRGGQPCPNCGGPISEVTASQRVTSFCRRCQS